MKFDVTFYFENCTPTVTVDVEHENEAIGKARLRDYPPVADDIPATCVYSGSGGKRKGAGVKNGSIRTKNPRTGKKQICLSVEEWSQIKEKAESDSINVAAYMRSMGLNGTYP